MQPFATLPKYASMAIRSGTEPCAPRSSTEMFFTVSSPATLRCDGNLCQSHPYSTAAICEQTRGPNIQFFDHLTQHHKLARRQRWPAQREVHTVCLKGHLGTRLLGGFGIARARAESLRPPRILSAECACFFSERTACLPRMKLSGTPI